MKHTQSTHEREINSKSLTICADAVHQALGAGVPRDGFEGHVAMMLRDVDEEVKRRIKSICGDWQIYGQEMFSVRVELRRRGGFLDCIGCGSPVRIDLGVLEDFLLNGKKTKQSLSGEGRAIFYEQPPELYDVSVCCSEKGVFCLQCTDKAVKANQTGPLCPKCRKPLSGLDQFVR